MSAQAIVTERLEAARSRWPVWRVQLAAIAGTELRRHILTKRGLWIYLLALMPVFVIWMHSLASIYHPGPRQHPLPHDTQILSGIFQIFYLRLAIFFGCVGIFSYLFRGEVLEKSLHYYFLAPVRRELLVVGKYLAGVGTACIIFTLGVVLMFSGMYLHYGSVAVQQFLFEGGGLWQLIAYLGVTVLACLGYGAVFLFMGVQKRDPMLIAALVLGWEGANAVLPGWLQRFSVIHYLQQLCPVPMPGKGPELLLVTAAEPLPGWLAVLGLLTFSGLMLWLTARRVRRMQINYSAD